MNTIIAGSRTCTDPKHLELAVRNCGWGITAVIGGKARGADALGEQWALANGVPFHAFPADWNKHGKSAGYLRNKEMAAFAEGLIALWDGKSRGTAHMINVAQDFGLRIYIHRIDGGN